MSFSELRDQQHQMLYTGHNTQNTLTGKSASEIHARSCAPRWRKAPFCAAPAQLDSSPPREPKNVSSAVGNKQSETKIKPISLSNRQLAFS